MPFLQHGTALARQGRQAGNAAELSIIRPRLAKMAGSYACREPVLRSREPAGTISIGQQERIERVPTSCPSLLREGQSSMIESRETAIADGAGILLEGGRGCHLE
ncbi:MAG: hypothetical protein KDI64_01110 [Candidatus Accumulibacter sp.]|nr:hypothetical protein [Accumulibacter sp.]